MKEREGEETAVWKKEREERERKKRGIPNLETYFLTKNLRDYDGCQKMKGKAIAKCSKDSPYVALQEERWLGYMTGTNVIIGERVAQLVSCRHGTK